MNDVVEDTLHTIQLPDILDIKAASPLASAFLARRGADLVVDASNVQRLGGQCLQVLLSAVATWQADDMTIEISKPSAEFTENLERLGITPAQLLNRELGQ